MNRVEKHHDDFAIAFGVDDVTGAFVQVWRAPMDKQDGAFLIIDSLGVHFDPYALQAPAQKAFASRAASFVRASHGAFECIRGSTPFAR